MRYEEEADEEYWLDLAEEKGEQLGVDTREGSVYMDMQAGHCIRTAKFYNDLNMLDEMLAIDTCCGDILKEKAAMDGVLYQEATPSFWNAEFVGVMPEYGQEFMCGDYYFTWTDVDGISYLVSEIAGEDTNNLKPGAELIPVDNIDDLESAVLGNLVIPGKAEESDDSLRERWQTEKKTPSKNGNKPHYKTWCEEIAGVGRAKVFPLWGGSLTVKAVLLSDTGQDVSEEIVTNVQNYIDPIEEGYSVTVNGNTYIFGDGMGEGVANLGAHFLAESAKRMPLKITAGIVLMDGYTIKQIEEVATAKITEYLSAIALKTPEENPVIVRIASIGSIITAIEGVVDYDYDSLMLNEQTENISVDAASVAVLSEVVFYVAA